MVVSPDRSEGGVWINQDARIAMARLDAGKSIDFKPAFTGNGIYIFVIEGEITVEGQTLGRRDALGISEVSSVTIQAGSVSEILAIEVPMFA